jgi:hypothetical protein
MMTLSIELMRQVHAVSKLPLSCRVNGKHAALAQPPREPRRGQRPDDLVDLYIRRLNDAMADRRRQSICCSVRSGRQLMYA